MTETSPANSGRRFRWWHGLLLAAAVVVVAAAGFVLWVLAAFSGGLDGLFSRGGPRPDDPQVAAARDAASRTLTRDTSRTVGQVVLPSLPAGSARLGAGDVVPSCQEGQHNFEVDTPFDLSCTMARREVVAVASRGTFRGDMVALDAALRAAGWEGPPPLTMSRVLGDYWDRLGGTPRGQDVYSMADLPGVTYSKTVDGVQRNLSVWWVERGSPDTALTKFLRESRFVRDGRAVSAADLVAAVPAGGYGVVVNESVEYFRG